MTRGRFARGWKVAAILLVWVAPVVLEAQDVTPRSEPVVPQAGEEVRVVQRGVRGAVYGRFVSATSAQVLLTGLETPEQIRIARTNITGMSVQRGASRQALAGALLGIGIGIAAGVVVGRQTDVFEGTGIAVGTGVGVALPVGLLIGWLIRTPEWDGVDMSAFPGGGSQ